MVSDKGISVIFAICLLPLAMTSAVLADEILSSSTTPVAVSTPTAAQASTPTTITVVHPQEGAKLPSLKEVFVYGAVVAGSTLTINGSTVPVHAKGGYLTMVPLMPGDNLLKLDSLAPGGLMGHLERRFTVATGFIPCPPSPIRIVKESITPADDMLLVAGDVVNVAFQGTPQATAEFSIEGVSRHIPLIETGSPPQGLYEGSYVIPPGKTADQTEIIVTLKKGNVRQARANGRLTIESGGVPRIGVILEDTVAARTATDGGYDLFLYKGMRVRLTGKIGNQWRVRFSAIQSGWVKESAIQELPRGSTGAQSVLTNMTVTYTGESSLIRIPLTEVLPYRLEQSLDPLSITVTLYGATNKTDLIRYDPADPLVRIVRWRQVTPDTCQIVIEPKFKKWWGFDVRYEGSTMIVEIRKPWADDSLRGMVIAVDPGHGGPEPGATGPHGTLEKDANLAIATVVVDTLEKSGAKPFLVRPTDADIPLYERSRIAWRNKARIFVSVHCNASGLGENPLWNNGSSVYFYQPQSQALAEMIHAGYRKHAAILPDRGLYYADFAVCRMTQMPAVLTEQAYIILPAQEEMLFDPQFQKNLANAIVYGIKNFVKP